MRSESILLPDEFFDVLADRFNIVDVIEFKKFDQDWNILREFFLATKKTIYDVNDRYIVIHQDTDIYISEMQVGVNLRNFFLIAQELNIPFYTLIIWTNHFGLQREIDLLCRDRHPADRPMVLESFCTTTHVGKHYADIDLNINHIKYHAISMMGAGRSHRYALYNALKDIPANRLILAVGPTEKK
jgi:hypothetical protein